MSTNIIISHRNNHKMHYLNKWEMRRIINIRVIITKLNLSSVGV